MDAPECESLGFVDSVDLYRQFSGPAHLAGKTIISNEMGAVHQPAFSLTIPELLFRIKRAMSGGVTMNVLHGSPYSGNYPNTTWPGYTAFYYVYTEMWNRVQPAWHHMKDILDYIGRNQFILQKGVVKVDLAVYQFQSPWNPIPENFSELVTTGTRIALGCCFRPRRFSLIVFSQVTRTIILAQITCSYHKLLS